MIEILNEVIGRGYEPLLDNGGNTIYAISGLDVEWIMSAVICCVSIYILLKMFVRIFIK